VLARRLLPTLALAAALLVPASASAAPPPNDVPTAPGAFAPYDTRAGVASDQQAIAELAEATADDGVPRCLGRRSFTRTVWYRLPAAPGPREVAIEASGRTTQPIDLAAFIQPGPDDIVTTIPNACAGLGSGGSDLAEDATPSLNIRVPANQAVLLQVGRHGTRASQPDEQVILQLRDIPLEVATPPRGDRADASTPTIGRRTGTSTADLFGALLTQEDPAVPSCPSAGSVWRRAVVPETGRWTVSVDGDEVGSLAVFIGAAAPDPPGFLGCVDREGDGELVLPLRRTPARQTLWIRLGTDRAAPGSDATVRFRRRERGDVESGGACLGRPSSRVGGRLSRGPRTAKRRNRFRRIEVVTTVARGPVCDARLALVGPRRRVYARADVEVMRGRGESIAMLRTRKLVKGRYRLRVNAASYARVRVRVPSSVSFKLRKK
jgi:hypothetical protein